MKIEDVIVSNGVAPVELPYFPMRWQAFIWRNWGLVPTAVLAKVLCASESQIEEDAREIGLPEHLAVSPKWRTHGYQTLIRRNWHILPMTQLLELLQWTPEQMAYTLKEEDFLGGKLGSAKPECKKLIRREPSAEEHRKTAELKAVFRRHFDESELSCLEQPFAFADKYAPVETANGSDLFEFNFIHSYAASCGDVFGSAESSEPVPENLLAQYASMGIKGIWMHALLYLLCPIPGAEEFSIGYEKRLGNLRKVIECCARYGIKVYLYLNEPRYMPLAFYDKKPLWGGVKLTNSKTICITRTPEPLEWLEHAMKTVFSAAPGLGGVFSITMSENATHCNYDMQGDKCPSCSKVKPQEIIARIITAMERGMHAAAPEVKMIAFDWAWRKDAEYRESADFKNAVVNLLPKSVYILSVSEWGMLTHIGNVEQYLIDYSISQVGPSEETLKTWKHAREIGLKIAAKIQINNSWELSAVPYIPTPYLI